MLFIFYLRHYGYLLIATLLLITSCNKPNGNSKNDRERWNLKGNVKSILETTYSESGKYVTTIFFTKEGFVKEQSSYNPDKSLIRKWIFSYRDDSLKNSLHCYILNDSLSYVSTYSYDDNNNTISITTSRPSDPSGNHSVVMTYDEENHKIKESTYDADNNIQHEALFKYSNNSLTEEQYYDAVLNQKWKQINRYNRIRKKEETLFVTMQDSILNRKIYKYNDEGQLIETSSFKKSDSLVTKVTYTYTKTGDEKERATYSADKIEETQKREYRYDKNNNFIFMSLTVNNKPKDIITRDIQYYD